MDFSGGARAQARAGPWGGGGELQGGFVSTPADRPVLGSGQESLLGLETL